MRSVAPQLCSKIGLNGVANRVELVLAFSNAQSAERKKMQNLKNITISKIIEYAFATPQRRTQIIENALTPPAFIVDTKYPEIERATAPFLASGCRDTSRLDRLELQLQKSPVNTEHQESRLLNAFEALDYSRQFQWELPEDTLFQEALDLPQEFTIGDINVRVRPNALLMRHKAGRKFPEIGVVKPYFSKTFPLQNKKHGREIGVLYASLLHWYTETILDFMGDANPQLCIIGDIFNGSTYQAAPRFKQRRKQLTAIAQEISDRWEPISERIENDHRGAARQEENVLP